MIYKICNIPFCILHFLFFLCCIRQRVSSSSIWMICFCLFNYEIGQIYLFDRRMWLRWLISKAVVIATISFFNSLWKMQFLYNILSKNTSWRGVAGPDHRIIFSFEHFFERMCKIWIRLDCDCFSWDSQVNVFKLQFIIT